MVQHSQFLPLGSILEKYKNFQNSNKKDFNEMKVTESRSKYVAIVKAIKQKRERYEKNNFRDLL